MNELDFSIILASLGQRNTLRKTVDSIFRIDTLNYFGEFILVINGEKNIPDLAFTHPNISFKLIREPNPGHSIALNTGIKNSKGKVLVFTDDDAIVSQNWVLEYIKAMQNQYIGYSFGPIEAVYCKSIPKDWNEIAPPYLSNFDLGKMPIDFASISRNSDPVGVNMAINREVLKYGVKFNENLGPSPITGNVGGADTLLGRQIIQLNYKGRYVPNAKVKHLIENERMTLWYLLKRKYKIGKTALAYDFMDKNKAYPNLFFFVKGFLTELKNTIWNLVCLSRIKTKISLLKLFRSLGAISTILFNRNYYESIRKENYLFSSK